ncbi:MAG: hypothetical protein Q4G13_03250, partial [Moraxella sp.]|nr:hypothetical protein [Moraxella sp.]
MAISFSSIAKKFIIGIASIYGVYVLLIAALFIYSAIISHKVIEYDEEVKLSDGTMIWVNIKRHYRGTFGLKAYQRLGTTYRPREVEIGWDTGFDGVGRRSIVFGGQIALIDRYEN